MMMAAVFGSIAQVIIFYQLIYV